MRSRPSGRRPIRQAKQASQPDLRVIPCKSLDGLLALTAAVRLQKGLVVMDRTALGYLTDLNRNVEGALALLEKLAEYPELNNEDFIIFQSYFRESWAIPSQCALDFASAKFWGCVGRTLTWRQARFRFGVRWPTVMWRTRRRRPARMSCPCILNWSTSFAGGERLSCQ